MSQKVYLPDSETQASYCDLTCFDYEQHEHIWKKTIQQHPFNHKLSLFLPFCTSNSIKQHMQQLHVPTYYQVRLRLAHLLDPLFYRDYVQSSTGRLLLHTVSSKLDSDIVIAFNLDGQLVMNMDKFTYEAFGMVGKKQTEMDRKRLRYVVEVDLRSSKMGPGSKVFDRLKWCFENTMTEEFRMVATFVDQVTGETGPIQWANGVQAKQLHTVMELEDINSLDIPKYAPPPPLSATSPKITTSTEWEKDILKGMQWIGLVLLKAAILKSSKVNPFLSTYQPPTSSSSSSSLIEKNTFGTVITWRGALLSPQFILNLFIHLRKLMITDIIPDWASLTVWGYRDTPYTWSNRQHYPHVNAENDYTFLAFPPNRIHHQQSFVSYKMLGSHHSFS